MRWLMLLRLLPVAGTGLLATAILLNLVIGLTPIAFIVWMSLLLSKVPLTSDASTLAGALGLAVAALVLQQVLAPFQAAFAEVIARRVDGHCVQRLMQASFQRADIATLETPGVLDKLADVRSAFDKALPTPGEAAAAVLALIARYTQLVGAVVLIAWSLHVYTAMAVAATALIIRFGQRGSLGRFAAMWDGLSGYRRRTQYLRAVAEGTEMAKEIRVLGLLEWVQGRLAGAFRDYFGTFWAARRRMLFWPFVGFAAAGLVGATIGFADLAAGTAGRDLTLLKYAVAVQALLIPIRFGVYFPECDSQTQFGWHTYRALLDFEATAVKALPAKGSGTAPPPREAIRFEGVSFGYPKKKVLKGLQLELAVGRSTAIVGLNGAGKTTLVKLLAGFYRPDEGRVTVDGRDLRDIEPEAWHRHLAVIFQDFVRYELSAMENIGLGDETEVLEAARKAGALSVVEGLPGGLSTPLFSRYRGGRDLSGGQWQRIALARALHAVGRGASVLVLDEPTAQLDVRAEVEFYDNFLERTRGLTTIVISHRFATVRRADTIVVLEHGAVVEQGSHDELLKLGGRYAHLFHLQASRFAMAS